jgi:eukaryotic-like serine/threonine-protein kinase
MPNHVLQSTAAEDRFEQVLAELLLEEDNGRPIEVEEAVKIYPELETPLRKFYGNRAEFDKLAVCLGPAMPHRAPPDLPPGSRIDDYEIIEEMDRGGRGIVYRVRDAKLNRSLAVKVLLPELRDNADAVRRFLEERQVTAQLQHPGIVPVHSVGELPDGRPYFAMKLVEGRTLSALLKERAENTSPQRKQGSASLGLEDSTHSTKDTQADLPQFLGIFLQICQAVAYAHSREVIHRDLKPKNVMVGAFAEVQVMDWGLGKVRAGGAAQSTVDANAIHTVRTGSTGASTKDGAVAGTYAYMSPEQARGEVDRIDERADVFGLGAVLCEILTGLPPYGGELALEIYKRAAAGDLADAFHRLDHSGADTELIALAKDCLAVERDARPRNAGVVAQRLAAHLANVQERLHKAELERAAAEARAREERRRRRWQGAAALIAVLFLTAGAGLTFWIRQRSAEIELVARDHVTEARRLSNAHQYLDAHREASQAEEITHSALASEGLQREIIDLLTELRYKADQEVILAVEKASTPRDEASAAEKDSMQWP